MSDERAEVFELSLQALYMAGQTMLQLHAKDNSRPLPPMREWEELPSAARAAFGIQTVDAAAHLMSLVEHISRVAAQEEA